MFAKLICVSCSAPLSGLIEIRSSKEPTFVVPDLADGKTVTMPGMAIKSWEPMMQSVASNWPVPLDFVPQYWLNPDDVDEAVEPVEDSCRLNGCCGLDGCDGPNMRCVKCATEVGTRQSDCWTPDVFIPEPSSTRWEV